MNSINLVAEVSTDGPTIVEQRLTEGAGVLERPSACRSAPHTISRVGELCGMYSDRPHLAGLLDAQSASCVDGGSAATVLALDDSMAR